MVAPYKLAAPGVERVLHANQELDREYVAEHDYQRPEIFFRHVTTALKNYSSRAFFPTGIDVCCGTGFLSERLQKENLVGKSYAVDMNPAALAYLCNRIASRPELNILPLNQDVYKMAIDEPGTDLIIGNSFLHHLPDNSLFLKRCFELILPGGVLFLVDEPSTAAERLENPAGFLTRLFRRKKRQERLQDVWLYSESGIRSLLIDAGFENIRVRGFGLFTTLANFFIYNVATRVFRLKKLPRRYFSIMYALNLLESRLFSFLPADRFSGLMVLAQKPDVGPASS